MIFLRNLVASLLVAAAFPAGAGTVEDRAGALSAAEGRTSELASRQSALAASLDQVARRIEQLKSRDRREAAVLPDPELDQLLRRSQELAEALSSLTRDQDQAHAARRGAALDLAGACDAEMESLRASMARGDLGALDRFATLDTLRARARALAEHRTPIVPAPRAAPSDDPDELRERADLLRDQRDRILSRMVDLDSRIVDLKDRAALEREMGAFLREGSLFDEHQRVRRTTRSSATSSGPAPGAAAEPEGDGKSDAPSDSDLAGSSQGPSFRDSGAGPEEAFDGGSSLAPPVSTPPVSAPAPAAAAPAARASSGGSIPRFGADPRGVAGLTGTLSGNESLAELQAARAVLEREAGELERRAVEIERRARSLKLRE